MLDVEQPDARGACEQQRGGPARAGTRSSRSASRARRRARRGPRWCRSRCGAYAGARRGRPAAGRSAARRSARSRTSPAGCETACRPSCARGGSASNSATVSVRDVATAAAVEIARGGVVDRVVVAPAQEGRVDEQSKRHPEPVVGAPRGQERAVRAVVEEDERPHEEARGGDRDQRASAGRRRSATCTSAPTAPGRGAPRSPGRARCDRGAGGHRGQGREPRRSGSGRMSRWVRRRAPGGLGPSRSSRHGRWLYAAA